MQVIWYDEQKRGQTCTSNFNIGDAPDQLLRASARSGILQIARLLNMLLRRNTPPDVECLTNDELDVAAAVRKKTFLYRFFMNLATGRDETPTQAELKRNSYSHRRHFINFSMCELLDRAIAMKYEGPLSSYVQCLFKSPSEVIRAKGFTRLGISSNSVGNNQKSAGTDDPQAERGERTGRRALTPAQGLERGRDGGEVKIMTVTRA